MNRLESPSYLVLNAQGLAMPTLVHVTDLHLDHWPANLDAMLNLIRDVPADLVLIGGDNGDDAGLAATVEAIRRLHPAAAIAWIMGNHDLWRRPYTHLWDDFPHVPATYLELQNLETAYCTVVGTYGHYDYSGGTTELSHAQYETFTDGEAADGTPTPAQRETVPAKYNAQSALEFTVEAGKKNIANFDLDSTGPLPAADTLIIEPPKAAN